MKAAMEALLAHNEELLKMSGTLRNANRNAQKKNESGDGCAVSSQRRIVENERDSAERKPKRAKAIILENTALPA